MGIGEVSEKLRRSTVHVRRSGPRDAGGGSGFIWRSEGLLLTNAHVVSGAASVSAELWDGRELPAEVEDSDSIGDLAKLRIAASGLPHLELREAPAHAGEQVVAVGNPLGFTGAMTTGVVRAVGPLRGLDRRSWVQTALHLAPGNSGGPLADMQGRVVGINTMVMRGGIALAVPAASAKSFAMRARPPKLGVSLQEVTLRSGDRGLLVRGVAQGSRAEEASLLAGDILLAWNGGRLERFENLQEALATNSRGVAQLRFVRGDRARIREVAVKPAAPETAGVR